MRLLAVGALVLLVVVIVLGTVYRSSVSAHARAAVVLSTTLQIPVAAWLVRVVTGEPRLEERTIGGAPTTVAWPAGEGPWRAIVFVNGATERGRRHPAVRRLATGLARAGFAAYVPDVYGLARGEITERTVAEAVAVAQAAQREARDGRVGLAGVSVGTTLALLVAEDVSMREHVSIVAGVAPYAELVDVIRLATIGRYRRGAALVPYRADPFVRLAVARSLAAGLPDGPDRTALRAHLAGVGADADDPLAGVRAWPRERLRSEARAVVELLSNREPARFDALYARFSPAMRASMKRLSPLEGAGSIEARVELASAQQDKYFPLAASRALVAAAPDGHLTVTETLDHAVPSASLDEIAGLFRFYGFLLRSLRHASG